MGYKKLSFGSLYVNKDGNSIAVDIPKAPVRYGDYFPYEQGSSIALRAAAASDKTITWIKPNRMPILVADRVLLACVSHNDLVQAGFASDQDIAGTVVWLNGIPYCCRLLDLGEKNIAATAIEPNEWDVCLCFAGEKDDLWHWRSMFTIGSGKVETDEKNGSFLPVCGFNNPHYWSFILPARAEDGCGFRPVLEPLQTTPFCQYREVVLDNYSFCVVQNKVLHTRVVGFRPALYPQKKTSAGTLQFDEIAFAGLPDGRVVRMYSLLMDGNPVRQDLEKPIKCDKNAELRVVDEFFGEEYLILWTIHHGCAFAMKDILSDVTISELVRQGYLPK